MFIINSFLLIDKSIIMLININNKFINIFTITLENISFNNCKSFSLLTISPVDFVLKYWYGRLKYFLKISLFMFNDIF